MKLIDKELKDVFEKAGVTDFVQALVFLSMSGCYSRVEIISNTLHYFKVEDINNYPLICLHDEKEVKFEFWKLPDNMVHLKDWLDHLFMYGEDEVVASIYEPTGVITTLTIFDYQFITKDYKGIQMRKPRQGEIDNRYHDFFEALNRDIIRRRVDDGDPFEHLGY